MNQRRGCFKVFQVFWTLMFFVTLIILIGTNLVFSNIFGETCSLVHPIIFEIEASVIENTGEMLTAPNSRLPINQDEIDAFFSAEAAYNPDTSEDEENANSTQLDTYLRIYDASGETLLAFNDDFDSLASSIRQFGVTETQDIIVEVGTYNDSQEGTFTLTVEMVDASIIPLQPTASMPFNNVFDAEYQIDNTGETITEAVFNGERVRYTMTAQANQAYNISVAGSNGVGISQATELDTYIRIYDETASILYAENDDLEGLSSGFASFGVPDSQMLIIEIATFSNESVGEFMLTLTPVDGTIAFSQGSPDTADVTIFNMGIELDNSGESTQGFVNVGERVRYTFFAEANQAYEILVSGTNAFVESSDTAEGEAESEIAQSRRSISTFSNESNAANRSPSCLQFFGFVSDSGFVINLNGFIWFVSGTEAEDKIFEACSDSDAATTREFLEQCVQATIRVSREGRMIFFVLLAILVVSLPILIVDALEGQRESIWYIFLLLVAVQATTTAMLFLHLGTVSGIDALSEFGYGIFGGITTGSALVFIDKLASRAEDGTSMLIPPDEERRE